MANIAIPGMAAMYRALLACVTRASRGLSKHGVGVEPLFCLDFWDRERGGRGHRPPSLQCWNKGNPLACDEGCTTAPTVWHVLVLCGLCLPYLPTPRPLSPETLRRSLK